MNHLGRVLFIFWALLIAQACSYSARIYYQISSQNVNSTYWTEVFSIGSKTDRFGNKINEVGLAADLCEGTVDCIRISWKAFSLNLPAQFSHYAVFRRAKNGSFDDSSPIGYASATSTPYYIDKDPSLIPGQSYYYKVGIIYEDRIYFGNETITELYVYKPENNMAFVHRWAVNQDICSTLGRGVGESKGSDPKNNFRCEYEGLGHKVIGSGKYYDLGKHLVVPRFELSCNYTKSACSSHNPGDGSSTTDCVGAATPTALGVTAPAQSVFLMRSTASVGRCYVYDGTSWSDYNSSTLTQMQVATGRAAQEVPLTYLSQTTTQSACQQQNINVDGSAIALRIPRKSEFMAYSSWPSTWTESEIDQIEAGSNQSGYCNSDLMHGLSVSTTYPPSDVDFLPTASGSYKAFSTGSSSTSRCVSRYGVQDAVGNLYEWTSDQITSSTGVISSVDNTNDEFNGIVFNQAVGPNPAVGTNTSSYPYFSVPLGIPLQCNSIAPAGPPACQLDDLLFTTSADKMHGDLYWLVNNVIARGSLVGGTMFDSNSAGRYRFAFDQQYNTSFPLATLRCVGEIP